MKIQKSLKIVAFALIASSVAVASFASVPAQPKARFSGETQKDCTNRIWTYVEAVCGKNTACAQKVIHKFCIPTEAKLVVPALRSRKETQAECTDRIWPYVKAVCKKNAGCAQEGIRKFCILK